MSQAYSEDSRLVPVFKTISVANEFKSKKEGRPIFDDMEVCEIRISGDRQNAPVFPAHSFSMNIDLPDGTSQPVTYAERFQKQYQAFKSQKAQVKEGTPVDELPFLTQAKRSELRALNIYTAEALSALDGEALKTLGMGGRELKNQAVAYLQAASGTADSTKLAYENEVLRAQLVSLQSQLDGKSVEQIAQDKQDKEDRAAARAAAKDRREQLEAMSVDELKDWIEAKTDARPRGNPSKATLLDVAEKIAAEDANE